MAAQEIARVRYSEHQYLGAADFRSEQTYQVDADRRHVLAHHTWGIVVGLRLVETPVASDPQVVDVVIQPGLAIDAFGRRLVALAPRRLDPADFASFNVDGNYEVWIAYDEDPARVLGPGWAECESGKPTRTVETWKVVVQPPPPVHDAIEVDGLDAVVEAPPPPAGTPGIPADQSVPYQELPHEPPGDRWPIRLGTVHWDAANYRFKAGAPLDQGRRYAGAVADHLLSPTETLRLSPRRGPGAPDQEFATVEGRFRVKERLSAEKEVWVEGDAVHFTYDGADEQSAPITLQRVKPPSGTGHRLRLQLGTAETDTTDFTVGAGTTPPQDTLRVRADDVVAIETGRLEFGAATRQMIDLWSQFDGHQYGIGVQSGTLYQRSQGEFCWYRGGTHSNTARDPGGGGQLQLRLDGDGSLHFGKRIRQMLNLWGAEYGIGVQSATQYFRTHTDFAWYRRGSHNDGRGDPGGGTVVMNIDDTSHLRLFGAADIAHDLTVGAGGSAVVRTRHVWGKAYGSDDLDSLYLNWNTGMSVVVGRSGFSPSDLLVTGSLRVEGSTVESVVKVETYPQVVQNSGANPGSWSQSLGTDFTEIFAAFVVFQGFSFVAQTTDFDIPVRKKSIQSIPQHMVVKITSQTNTLIQGTAHVCESNPDLESDNCLLFTLVVIGRKV
jgi:hypothetical protein